MYSNKTDRFKEVEFAYPPAVSHPEDHSLKNERKNPDHGFPTSTTKITNNGGILASSEKICPHRKKNKVQSTKRARKTEKTGKGGYIQSKEYRNRKRQSVLFPVPTLNPVISVRSWSRKPCNPHQKIRGQVVQVETRRKI